MADDKELTPRAARKLRRHLAADAAAKEARFWVGKIKSADRMAYTHPANRAAAKMLGSSRPKKV
jgi:hypothetical protein